MLRVSSLAWYAAFRIGVASALIVTSWLSTTLGVHARPLGTPPGTARSGAVRGGCTPNLLQQPNTIIAFVDSEVAQTRKARPTFVFYLPIARSPNVTTALLSVKTEDQLLNEDLDKGAIAVSLPDQPGIVSITVPKTYPALEVGKRYFWSLTVVCSQKNPSANLSVSGFLERVNQPIEATASTNQPISLTKVNALNENDTWYEWVEQLVRLRSVQSLQWNTLLDHFGLLKYERSPVVELQLKDAPSL